MGNGKKHAQVYFQDREHEEVLCFYCDFLQIDSLLKFMQTSMKRKKSQNQKRGTAPCSYPCVLHIQ